MTTLHLMVHGLADIVEETTATSKLAVETKLIGDDLAEIGNFDGMPEDILTEARPEVQFAHRFDDLGMEASDIGLQRRLVAHGDDSFVHVLSNG